MFNKEGDKGLSYRDDEITQYHTLKKNLDQPALKPLKYRVQQVKSQNSQYRRCQGIGDPSSATDSVYVMSNGVSAYLDKISKTSEKSHQFQAEADYHFQI